MENGAGLIFFQYNFEETYHFIEQSKFSTPLNNKEINHQALLNISYDSMQFWASFSRRIGPDQTNVGSSENAAFKSNHNSYDIRHLRQRLKILKNNFSNVHKRVQKTDDEGMADWKENSIGDFEGQSEF